MARIQLLVALCVIFILNDFTLKAQTYATLPFTETFENAWVNKDATRDVPSVYWKNTPATGSNSWSRDDDGVARGAWTNSYPNSPAAANGSVHSASFNSYETYLSGTLDLYVNFGTLAGSKALYFWYINVSGDDKFEVTVSTDGGITFGTPLTTLYNTTVWSKICVDLGTTTSSTGVIRFKGIHVLNQSSSISIDDIYIGTHSSTPIVADFSTDRISGIAPLTVNFTDKSIGDVTNWSWDFNNDGTVDATAQNPVYTFYTAGTFTTNLTSYKPGISALKTITITTTPQVYASLPFIEDFDHTWVNREETSDVPSLSFKNNPCTGNNSWRRNDDGVSANWMNSSDVYYSPSGAQNSQYSARFHSSFASYSGILDAFIDFSTQTGSKTVSFWYINHSGNDKLEIYLSTDGGVTFGSALLTLAIQKSWEKVTYDLGNITSSTGVIRFKTIVEYDSRNNGSDIGIDNIRLSNPTEIPIDAYFTSDKTSGQSPLTVNFTDKSGGTPTSWKWDFNNDGVIDATIQNPSYTYSTSGVYTVKLSVRNSNYSGEVIRTNYIVVPGYAGLPYNQTFENDWVNRDNVRDVPDNFWKGNPATGSNSWSREDDGVYRGAWNYSTGAYSPSGADGSLHSACFNSYNVYNGTGSIDLYVNFSSQTGEKRLTFWYINKGGNDKLDVFLSTDGGTTFGTVLTTVSTSTFWTKVTVNLGNITSATGVLRFKASTINRDQTATSIGIDDVKVAVPALLPLNAEFMQNVISGNAPLTINFVDQSEGVPTLWKWDFNNDGITDATTQNPSYIFNNPGIYSVKMVVRDVNTSDSIIKANSILVPGYASLPFSENFENDWFNRDGLRDVPSYYYKNNPASGENSWSRNDDALSRSAWVNAWGTYSQTGANNSLRSARFHSWGTTSVGIMDLFVDFSTLQGNKTLSFWYINASGSDSLNVYLSIDGGATDGTLITTAKIASSWTKFTADLGNVATSAGVIRFKAKGDWGASDIGVDDIAIETTGITPVNAMFSSNVTQGFVPLTVKFVNQSTGSPTSWKWDLNGDGKVDSITQNPLFTYNKVGKYSVNLEVSKVGTIDKETKVEYISVYDKVKAEFSADKTEGFAPLTVNFNDQSTGDPDTWEWDFDNNGITDAISQNASYTYTRPGSYSVKLIISNPASNDTIIKSFIIHVRGKASLPFVEKFDDDWKNYQATRDVPSLYWVNSPAKAMYSWSRDDDGVARGAWNSNDAGYNPAGADGSLHSARFHTYDFMSGYISSFSLYVDFSTLAGNKTLSFYYINPGGTDKLNVYLSTNGGTTFGSAITTQTTSSTWTKVDVDLGNVTSANGVILFDVTADLDDTDIGIDELAIQTTGVTPVAAQFTSNVTSGVVPLTVKFTDQSTGTPTSWQWDFNNDGVIDSTTQNPSYTFSKTGIYTVRLVSSKPGATDSEVKLSYISVVDPVDAKFTADKTSGIGPLTVEFIDQSTGNPTSWSWDFNNDGVIDATTQNPTYTYNSAGNFTVKLVVSKTNSTDTETKASYIAVTAPVVAEFSANKTVGIVPFTISFTDQSTGSPTTWNWDFNNDGVIDATTKNPSYTFTTAGTYTINLTSSKTGSSNKKIKTDYVTVIDPMNANFVADKTSGKAPLTVKFTDQSTGVPSSWSWDFNNDGVQDSTTQNPTYTFTSSGTYTVKLVISKLGFNDTEIKTNYIVVTPATDINSIVSQENFVSVYPSPATNWAKVKLENFGNRKVKLEIINMQGVVISSLDITGQETHEFDFSNYARGIYYLKIVCRERIFINKLILE